MKLQNTSPALLLILTSHICINIQTVLFEHILVQDFSTFTRLLYFAYCWDLLYCYRLKYVSMFV